MDRSRYATNGYGLRLADDPARLRVPFTDGRRCRTSRSSTHPHFCVYHAQKEAQARAAERLGKDIACSFSGDYLSACDLSTALSRLIAAVIRGDIKPQLALTQSIHCEDFPLAQATSRPEPLSLPSQEPRSLHRATRDARRQSYDSPASGLRGSSTAQRTFCGLDRSKSKFR
jgi:hypothetical protein